MPPRTTWTPTSGEDKLLHQYWKNRGGKDTLYTEVGIAGRRKASHWREGSTERRLDGVCLVTPTEPGIFPKKGTTGLFKGLDAPVDIIEVKRGLSEAVIGQCLVGRLLFAKQYPGAKIRRTIALCRVADSHLLDVCKQPGVNIHVEVIPPQGRSLHPMTSRTAYLLTDEQTQRIDPWRRERPGLYFTRVPVGESYVSLLRVADTPDLLAYFDTPERFRAAVSGRPVELIEVRRALTRGVVGRVVAHALMLKAMYGVEVDRRVILVGKADTAILWACEQLGIDVKVLRSLATR